MLYIVPMKKNTVVKTFILLALMTTLSSTNARDSKPITIQQAERSLELLIKKLSESSTQKSKRYYQKKISALLKEIKANNFDIETPRL